MNDIFLDIYHLIKLSHDERSKLNKLMTPSKTEVIQSLPTSPLPPQKKLRPVESSSEFNETFLLILLKLFCKEEIKGIFANSFYESTVMLIPHKDTIKKENYRPISLKNV